MSDTPKSREALPDRIGKYEIVDVVGRGAMGVVYHAYDGMLEREVALKVMLPAVAGDPDQKARFEREARAAAKIVHRNVLTVFDLGYHHDGSPYIAMELLRGRDLLQVMRHGPPMTLEEKVNGVVQILDGLAHAHFVGVIHRDIKPANVFLTDEGTVKIMDFGVARFTMSTNTSEGAVMGSPDYMSPEQVQGLKVDARTDLWSVGCVLHELVTGHRPFGSDTLMTIFYKITHDDPKPELPPGPEHDALRPILRKALQRDFEHRYQTAAQFAADLRAFLGSRPPAAPVAPAAGKREEALPTLDLLDVLTRETPLPPPTAAPQRAADPSPLFGLMREIYVAGKSGHLHFTHGRQRRSLFFLRGGILHGTSDVEGEQLGHVLVRYGFIPQATLERLIPIVLRERKRLGAVLQAQRALEKARLDEAVGLHVRDLLFTVLDRSDGSFAFEETAGEAVSVVEQEAHIAPGQIILEAARRLQAPEVTAKVLGDLDRPLGLSTHPRLGVQKLTLSPTDGFLLSRIDGVLTAREIFQIIPLPQEDIERSLFALLCTGMVAHLERPGRVRPPADAERLPSPVPAAPIPPAPIPPPAAIPPVATGPAPPAPGTPAVVWDLEGLPAPTSRIDERTASALEGIREARRLIGENQLQDAIDRLGPVLTVLQGRDLARARVTLARAYAKVPAWVRRAEELLLGVLQESPDLAEAHVVLGEVYLAAKARPRAIASFRKALELDPSNDDATGHLAALGALPTGG